MKRPERITTKMFSEAGCQIIWLRHSNHIRCRARNKHGVEQTFTFSITPRNEDHALKRRRREIQQFSERRS